MVHSSTKVDDALRYLSLYDNRYIRYFAGHKKKVVSMEISPADDTLLTASQDSTVRMWDTRSPNCTGILKVQGAPLACFGAEGLMFCVGTSSSSVSFYDARNFKNVSFDA